MESVKIIKLNISPERAFCKPSKNTKIIEIGRTARKLLSLKELLSNLGDYPNWVCLIANFEIAIWY